MNDFTKPINPTQLMVIESDPTPIQPTNVPDLYKSRE